MKIGELFVGLGVKGSEKALSAITGVKEALGATKDMSLEAKAGIVGALYALEKLMASSAAMGTGLTNFNALTGMSAQMLQQWQYAARQAGVSGEELTGSLKGVQATLANMLLGKGAPEGMAMLANTVGFDAKRARDTQYVMKQLQEFAQKVPADIGNSMLKSFGLTEGVIAGMRRNAFTPENFAKAPTYSDNEASQLDKINVAWGNLGQKIEMAIGHLNSKHGLTLINDITKLTDALLRMGDVLTQIIEKFKLLSLAGRALSGFADILGAITGTGKPITSVGKAAPIAAGGFVFNPPSAPVVDEKSIAPPLSPSIGQNSQQNIEVNQTLQFQHDGKDAKKTGDSTHKAVRDAFWQIRSGQVN